MPSRNGHRIIRAIFGLNGSRYEQVDDFIDAKWALKALGPSHRLVNHSPIDLIIRFGLNDQTAAGLVHLGADYLSSQYKKELRKRLGADGYRAWKALMEQAAKTK